jgi:hypothetical protein
MDSKEAATITGLLYGNLLHRDADEAGYSHYFRMLTSYQLTLHEAIGEFLCSEEFASKFIVNQTPNELATHLLNSLFGARTVAPTEPNKVAFEIIRLGVPAVIRKLLADVRFQDQHGEFGVPRYVERH